MSWRELWQTTMSNLRAFFGRRDDAASFLPPLPEETAAHTRLLDSDDLAQPAFPTVWDDPSPAPAPPPPSAPPSSAPESLSVQPTRAIEMPTVEMPVDALPTEELPSAEIPAAEMPAEAQPVPAPVIQAADAEVDTGAPDAAPTAMDAPAGGPTDAVPADAMPALSAVLESVLFVASEPVTPTQLARSLNVSEAEVQAGLAALDDHYRGSGRGLQLQQLHGKVQLVTAPAVATYVEAFLNLDATTRLSGPALETLAVVAYRQPVTRAQVEAIRGVDCAGVLRSLVQRGLITEAGRLESAGRPILYGVTELFMQHFGLADLKELPPLEESEADRLWAATLLAGSDPAAEPDADAPPDSTAPPTPNAPPD